ncbi:MAG: PhoH family protein [Candidatus Dadabacteria bacterium]|nr:PhoH family protein [Candidatus Dadabacteria bacterium]NIS10065.1 PhoH family protein [Candidatus Dadabacteria bacterium]NIV42142.1 AAA family ATPase [Candidatus Dadabacteria bacterium]NIX16451.1 AAA family ATPase [Candidatus Dadabacteria bacterium]NIY23012.1 AAA family ATPase [Candidatus Dadabacteria bacterium]
MSKTKKIFVLDTNVILHDSACIYEFQHHDVVLPVTVLEELDRFKKGSEILNYHAREFVRILDSLSADKLMNGGIKIGAGLGKLRITLDQEFHKDLILNFSINKPDHHILNIAYHISKQNPDRQVILVTKDVNLRLKAKSISLLAQDYKSDQVKDIATLPKGFRTIEDFSEELIKKLFDKPYQFEVDEFPDKEKIEPNEYFILRKNKFSVLAKYDKYEEKIKRIDKVNAYGITPRNAEQTFALDALMDSNINLVSVSGKAGTGKTLLALAAALERRKNYRQIYMARPIIALSNRDIGYLPGDIESKLFPYMQPLYDNLSVIQNQYSETEQKYKQIKKYLEEEKLVISPLAYIRGRSLVKIYFIVDEAQNLTPHEVKTIITRAGENTKIVFTGDIFQIDHPYLDTQSNGLSYLIEKMQGQSLYAHINLEKGERSELADLATSLL